jgi:DNA-binding NarL/FixJ family response regulator
MPSAPGERPLRLILVEDNASYREQLTLRLDGLPGIQIVHSAEKSGDACTWLKQNENGWDLLVLDIFLTEGHGYEILKCVRDRRERQHAVFLTSYTRDPARSQALALGANAVFDKLDVDPFLDYVQQRRDALAHADCP